LKQQGEKNKALTMKYVITQSAPKTTSPMPLSSINWFGLAKIAFNLLNQIEKILLKCCSGLFVKKKFLSNKMNNSF
jgi:hypothetical protein